MIQRTDFVAISGEVVVEVARDEKIDGQLHRNGILQKTVTVPPGIYILMQKSLCPARPERFPTSDGTVKFRAVHTSQSIEYKIKIAF